jgi:hypothetical protein
VFNYILNGGYGVRQAVRQSDVKDKEPANLPREPFVQGPALLLALEKRCFQLFKHLWGDNFVDVWGPKHFQMLVDVAAVQDRQNFLKDILNESCGQNLFLTMKETRKLGFVKNVLQAYQFSELAYDALCQKYYAPYLLLNLIERDHFRKLTDYTYYEKCLDLVSQQDLEEMSKNPANEELFMNFLRYTTLLNQDDIKRVKGQMLMDKVFEIEKFKAIKNQSLGILDYESQILEEEEEGDAAKRVHVHAPLPQKVQPKDFDWQVLNQYFESGNQQNIIDYLRAFKVSDLLSLRGPASDFIYTHVPAEHERDGFYQTTTSKGNLNVLQMAVINKFYTVVNYILSEHRIIASNRQLVGVDPRIILANRENEDDETLTLRLAIEFYPDSSLFYRFWAYYPHLFNERHLMTVTRFMLFLRKYDYVQSILNSNTAHRIFLNSSEYFRREYVDLFNESTLQYYDRREEILTMIKEWHPYRVLESEINSERLSNMFNLIKDNEVDHLRAMIEGANAYGAAHLKFDYVEYDEEALQLAGDERVTVSQLNPILLAIKYRSFQCLSYLIETFGLRQAMKQEDIVVKSKGGEFPYRGYLVPLLARVQDTQILEYIVK